MERYRIITIIVTCFWLPIGIAQSVMDTSTVSTGEAYRFKLDYNIPESPAFSILEANPTTIMRASTPQEIITHLASDFLSGNRVSPGLALDFNPYFVFGGRLQNITEYRNSGWKRFLANMQISVATINAEEFPDDLLFSGGLRATLFDSKDILFDKKLGRDIDMALIPDPTDDPGPLQNNDQGIIQSNTKLSEAYTKAKTRYRETAGGSIAIGYAIAGRAKNISFKTDSIVTYRHQAWVSGQYDMGKSGLSINAMVLYRYEQIQNRDNSGLISGISLRRYGKKLILSAEIYHDSLKDAIEFGGYAEAYLLPNITVFASLKKETNDITGKEEILLKPGIKWNFSESQ